MSLPRIGTLLGVALALAACGDTVVLRDGVDGIALTYPCDAIGAQAVSTAERAVVRKYSAELLRTGVASDPERVSAMVAAYDADNWSQFEQLVVEQLCADPSIAERVAPPPAPSRYTALGQGDAAPPFSLPILSPDYLDGNGARLALSDFRGRYVVLAFWSTWCVPCAVEYPELVDFEDDFADRGVTVVGILHRDSPAEALAFSKGFADAFVSVVDEDAAAARAYQIRGVPVTVVVDPDGNIVDQSLGWFEGKGAELRAHFEVLLSD